MNLKEILHVIADGISLTGPLREDLHNAIEELEELVHPAPAPAVPAPAPAVPAPAPAGDDSSQTPAPESGDTPAGA